MLQITVYGGAGTVGGNQVLVEDARGAFFLDFGTPYALRNRYYEEFLKPRSGSGLLDVLTLGLLPPLEGLYRSDLEPGPGLWPPLRDRPGYRRLKGVEGVLLSHAHLDHAGYISFLREETPIYASLMTAMIIKAGQDVTPLDIEREVAYCAPREVNKEGYLAIQRGQRHQRPYTFLLTQNDSAMLPGRPVQPFSEALEFWDQVGGPRTDLQRALPGWLPQVTALNGRGLRHYPVDHSVLGATAFAVETS
ncbi:MAG: exonuclease, partial [Chloroflexi bacterium]|nr:exonuclease [Chloroflexota bacterium]